MKPELLKEIAQIKYKIFIFEDFVLPKDVSFSNIKFHERALKDKVNRNLLKDINTAAIRAGVVVEIGYITSEHGSQTSNEPSRHPAGVAVDVNIIDGQAVSPKIREKVESFTKQLESLGYKKNVEEGNEKAFLTFGFPDHDNHVHVSNKSDLPSEEGEEGEEESGKEKTGGTEDDGTFKEKKSRFDIKSIQKNIGDIKARFGL
jgi:hypothetical protein